MKTYKGKFRPKHPEKYKGDSTNIIYRSSWELRMCKYLDTNSNVIEWASEEFHIPYFDPTTQRTRRYFPDYWVRIKEIDGSVSTLIIEVKPKKQTMPPKIPKRKTKYYLNEVKTWGVNEAKWKAARMLCLEKGWKFQIITEIELGINKLNGKRRTTRQSASKTKKGS